MSESPRNPVVLVADDSAQIQLTVRREFEEQGWDVVAAVDGETALRLGIETEIDAAVLDLLMPGRTGPEVLHGWREAGQTFPVLVLSALQDEERVVALLEFGAVDYIRKPFNPSELAARVHNWLQRP